MGCPRGNIEVTLHHVRQPLSIYMSTQGHLDMLCTVACINVPIICETHRGIIPATICDAYLLLV